MLRTIKLTREWAGHEKGTSIDVDSVRYAYLMERGYGASPLAEELEITHRAAAALEVAGYGSVEKVLAEDDDVLSEIQGIGEATLEQISGAREQLESDEETEDEEVSDDG